ncbi:MAG: ElyC/SanA/YdcF family protein [Chitinophagales bacterium]
MKFWKYLSLLLVIILATVFGINKYVELSVKQQLFSSVEQIPKNEVGLLLGTSKYASGGKVNLFYQYRIDAAVELFLSGKIDFILVSGDNATKEYDEPTTIKRDLIARGIPKERIILDYAGFRTLDSVVRSREIFGQNQITIISQKFHNERAVFIANKKELKAIGYNAKSVNIKYGFKTLIREKLARVKMVSDLLLGKEPKFYGEKILIGG